MNESRDINFIQEIVTEGTKVCIVAEKNHALALALRNQLKILHADVHLLHSLPSDRTNYAMCVCIDYPHILPDQLLDNSTTLVLIYTKDENVARLMTEYAYSHQVKDLKILLLSSGPEWFTKDADAILWFVCTSQEDIFLHIYHETTHTHPENIKPLYRHTHQTPLPQSKFHFVRVFIYSMLISQCLFILPLCFTSLLLYYRLTHSQHPYPVQQLNSAQTSLHFAESLYTIAAPTYRLLGISRPFDDMFALDSSTIHLIAHATQMQTNATLLLSMITNADETRLDRAEIVRLKSSVFKDIRAASRDLEVIKEHIPTFLPDRTRILEKIDTYTTLLPSLLEWEKPVDAIFGLNKPVTYLLMFANNMELRPGGGFIGSFALVRFDRYKLSMLKVYDVYDADGQLKEHIDPPEALSKYLGQPHWFFRDSAFSPDFMDNFLQGRLILNKEMSPGSIDGGILFTTTAVQQILKATGPITVSDFNETVTSDNFYLKTQLYAENGFFPGSTQKKSFLSSLLNELLLHTTHADSVQLYNALLHSFDEKQIVFASLDSNTQSFFETKYWAGRMLTPECRIPKGVNCILDYIFPVDANLGVNKANYFVSKPMKLEITIDDEGKLHNILTLTYMNRSESDVFPGGPYKNYFSLYFAPNTEISSITVDNIAQEDFEETNFDYTRIGLFFVVPPHQTRIVRIKYTLPTSVVKGDGVYQLMFQKQIGAPVDDLSLHINLPDNLRIRQGEFSPLVKDQKIDYNTSISSDKIIVIEYKKQ